MIRFLGSALWPRLTKLSQRATRRHVAVAYLSAGAFQLLKLGEDDILVVDMGDASVKSGRTDPREITTYLRAGVRVFSVDNLHAKAFVFDDVVVIGSANVSRHSRDHLVEAAIETTDQSVRSRVVKWIRSMALAPVTPELAAAKARIYEPPSWGNGTRRQPAAPRYSIGHLWIINTKQIDLSPDETSILDSQAAVAKGHLKDSKKYFVDSIRFPATSGFARRARVGHLAIEIHHDGATIDVYPPARVVYSRAYRAAGKQRVGIHLERRNSAKPFYWRQFRATARRAGVRITTSTEKELRNPATHEPVLRFFGPGRIG